MTEERFKLDERDYSLAILDENDEVLSFQETVDLLNKQENKLNQVLNVLEEADIFSEEALQNDSFAYMEMLEFDNKDAYAIALAIKSVIKVIKDD